jgi:hypothetical protein
VDATRIKSVDGAVVEVEISERKRGIGTSEGRGIDGRSSRKCAAAWGDTGTATGMGG